MGVLQHLMGKGEHLMGKGSAILPVMERLIHRLMAIVLEAATASGTGGSSGTGVNPDP